MVKIVKNPPKHKLTDANPKLRINNEETRVPFAEIR